MPYRPDLDNTLYNADWLREKYKTMNSARIAEELNCTRGAVLDNLRKHGIPIERGRFARHPGSHAPRPRKTFESTLRNKEWLQTQYVEKKRSVTDLAEEAGCSIRALTQALYAIGIGEDPRKVTYREQVSRDRARRKMKPGPCILCGCDGMDVNHKDRNPMNEADENLERLCRRCHRQQHCEEERVMMKMLADRGVPYIEIHKVARSIVLARRASS